MSRKLTLDRARAINRRRALQSGGSTFETPVRRVEFVDGEARTSDSFETRGGTDPLGIEPKVSCSGS